MNNQFYKDLHRVFIRLREAYADNVCDMDVVNAMAGELRFVKKQISKNAHKREKELLLTIVDTFFEVLDDNDMQKMRAYLEAVGDVPTIFLGERNLYSFRKQFQTFRDAYGQEYLVGIESVYPRFTKSAPKNMWGFFLPNSDDDFKAIHPVKYRWIVAWGLASFFTPMIAFVLFTAINEPPGFAWMFLGVLGCFVLGIGLFNIPAAFVHQYLGHRVTIGGIGIGLAMILISFPLMYNKTLVGFFDHEMMLFSIVSLLLLLLSLVAYAGFRVSVDSWLRSVKKVNQKHMKVLKKGYKNYWWYEALHEEYGMGAIYHLNKLYTILVVLSVLLTLMLGFFRSTASVICFVNVSVHILDMGIFMFTQIHDSIEKYGRWPVLWRRDENRHVDSVFIDIAHIAFLLQISYFQLELAAGMGVIGFLNGLF